MVGLFISMAKNNTHFVCQACGATFSKWQGKCFECGAWSSLVEEKVVSVAPSKRSANTQTTGPQPLFELEKKLSEDQFRRIPSGFKEIDRVLGGGFVPGSLLLFGGEPGIGKSTLLLQILGELGKTGTKALYVSGEESGPQVATRAKRLKVPESANLHFLATTQISEAIAAINELKPQIVVADSVQTLESAEIDSSAGTVSQVREVTQQFMDLSKSTGTVVLLVGHVTKEGAIAGPRLLEHMVDGVFYFEMAASGGYRLLRGNKNRFGATHELAVLEMGSYGLRQVENPSARFLAERAAEMSGSAVIAHLEGSRPFLTEFQAIVQRCYQGYPRRTVQGIDNNRVAVLLAVIEKCLKLNVSDKDVYCKVASGARIDEPAADLPILMGLVSALLDVPLPKDVVVVGEVGLGGELRSVNGVVARLMESRAVGFKRAFVPKGNLRECSELPKDIQVTGIANIKELQEKLSFYSRKKEYVKETDEELGF